MLIHEGHIPKDSAAMNIIFQSFPQVALKKNKVVWDLFDSVQELMEEL